MKRDRSIGLLLAGIAATCACVLASTTATGAQRGILGDIVEMATSGLGAERVKTVPIGRQPGSKTRSVMSLAPTRTGALLSNGSVGANAEVEVSVTCLEPMPQCVGTRYAYSPFFRARLVLATGPDAHSPSNTTPISSWRKQRCSQKLPHRNHHCVLTIPRATRQLGEVDKLPCLTRCHVNLLVDAYHGSARKGNVLVIGSDDDDGIDQDKGMINAVVYRGDPPKVSPLVSKRRETRRVPVAKQGQDGKKKVVYSRRLDNLEAGERLLVEARMTERISHLSYSVLAQSQLLLSEKPGSVSRSGTPGKIASNKGLITAQNGFNCTQGPSGHPDPCVTRKAGMLKIFKDARLKPEQGEGPFQPLYVNLVVQHKGQFGSERHRSGDVARVARRGGFIRVTRYAP